MANEVLQKVGTQIIFADHGTDFIGGAAGTSLEVAGTDVQIDLTSITTTNARNSVQVDLGATRARQYSVMAAIEMAASVVAGTVVTLYWAPSPNSTAGNGNPGGASGTDAAYTGTAASTVAESVLQLQRIGVFVCTDDATGTVQVATVGVFSPQERYGSLVVVNNTAVSTHSDAVETHIVFNPIVDEVQ